VIPLRAPSQGSYSEGLPFRDGLSVHHTFPNKPLAELADERTLNAKAILVSTGVIRKGTVFILTQNPKNHLQFDVAGDGAKMWVGV
jgi:hypothetical protein